MRIVTYNIHGWRTADGSPNLDRVTRTLAATQADVIGLNEVFYPRRVEGDDRPALETLAARLDMHYVFGPCLRWPAQDQMPAEAYGNALLSRWPIVASAVHHLSPVEGKEQRGLLETRIVPAGQQTLTVYVTHLDHTDEEARLVQLRAVRSWTIRDRRRPHLILGDFNAISAWDYPEQDGARAELAAQAGAVHLLGGARGPRVVAQMEMAGYVDLQRRAGKPGQQSFIAAHGPVVRIDYVFANEGLAEHVKSCEVWFEDPGQEASDHRPVVASLDWPPPTGP